MPELDKLIAAANAVCADIEDLGFGGTADSYRESFVALATFSDLGDMEEDLRWTVKQARIELDVIREHVAAEERQHVTTTRYRLLLGGLTDRFTDNDLELL